MSNFNICIIVPEIKIILLEIDCLLFRDVIDILGVKLDYVVTYYVLM